MYNIQVIKVDYFTNNILQVIFFLVVQSEFGSKAKEGFETGRQVDDAA